jgi:hypothetical protein
MTNSPENSESTSVKDLDNPMFLAWLKGRVRGGKIEPDDQDYDIPITRPVTKKEASKLYRLAQTNKMMRMYGDWKAGQVDLLRQTSVGGDSGEFVQLG